MRDVAIIGVGMTQFGRHLDRSLKDLGAEAITAAVDDAGIEVAGIDAAFGGNSMAGIMTGQECIRAQTVLTPLGIRGIPVYNIENACATSSSALNLAQMAVGSGAADLALVLGVEKLYHADRQLPFTALAAANDLEDRGLDSETSGTFMEAYAQQVREYCDRTGAEPSHLAQVAVKNRGHAALNPYAQYREPVTVAEVLEAPVIAKPLTRLMCSPIGDGAAAAVLAPADAYRDAVRIGASVVRSGAGDLRTVERAARAAYEMAGVTPADVKVAEVHDAASPAELRISEELGLCAEGEAHKLVENGDTSLGGRLPINVSGGLVSRGHPVGATGLAQIVELTWQLRGEGGERQVDGADVAIAENAGGGVGGDAAAVAIHILTS